MRFIRLRWWQMDDLLTPRSSSSRKRMEENLAIYGWVGL